MLATHQHVHTIWPQQPQPDTVTVVSTVGTVAVAGANVMGVSTVVAGATSACAGRYCTVPGCSCAP